MNIFEQSKTQGRIGAMLVGTSLTKANPETSQPRVPEVMDAYRLALVNPTFVWRTFYSYISQVDSIANITEEDLRIIDCAHRIREERGGSSGSASHHNLVDFIRAITPEQRVQLQSLIRAATSHNSEFFQAALADLTQMMQNGHKFKIEGKKPQDGDPESDKLIWGHTQLEDSNVLIEFTICHFIERYMSAAFQKLGLEMANHKDWFLSCLTDMITLNYIRGNAGATRIASSWSVPREEEGGLGWLNEDRITAFRDAMASEA